MDLISLNSKLLTSIFHQKLHDPDLPVSVYFDNGEVIVVVHTPEPKVFINVLDDGLCFVSSDYIVDIP